MRRRRRPRNSDVCAESVVTVPGPVERVWGLLYSPDCAVVMGHAVQAWRDPDTPVGVGEIQVFVIETDGHRMTRRNRVLELEEGERALTESLDGEFQEYAETVVTPLADTGSVQVVHRGWFSLPRDTSRQTRAHLQAAVDQWAADITQRVPALCDPHQQP